jgi:hypothetical protein
LSNWKFSVESETYQFSILKRPNLVADICHMKEDSSGELTEDLKDIKIIVNNSENNDRTTEKVLSPIEKLVKYVQSPVREDNTDLINSLIDLSGSLESIGVEAHELTSILNETEKARLKLLKDNSKVGLSEKQFPIGYATLESIQPTAFIYKPLSVLSQKLENFTKNLETISETYTETKILYNELNALGGIDIKNYVLTKQQKMGFHKLVMNDDRLSRAELDLLINFMKSSVFANSKALQQRKEYYASLNLDNEVSFPDIAPLLQDVKTLQSKLTMRLEEMPAMLNKEEKQQLQQFLPALDEYYKDQIAAFSGGKSYLPLAKNLQNMQNEIKQNPVASNILEHSESLGFTMQRLYMLHWIAESLMKQKYNTTLGKSLGLYTKENPDKRDTFSFLRNAVKFRNDVAHNGTLWGPEDFENHIKTYEQGITLITKELQIDLANVNLEKINRPLSKEELKISHLEQFGVDASVINIIDVKLLQKQWTKNHEKLSKIFKNLKKREISVEKILEFDRDNFIHMYKNHKSPFEIVEMYKNDFFINAFAKKYFSIDSFEILVDDVEKIRNNPTNWLYRFAMLEKENKLTNEDLEAINQLRNKLNG